MKTSQGRKRGPWSDLASIAAMPNKLRQIALSLILAGALVGVAGCGNSSPDPSIDRTEAATLLAQLQEIQANVEVGSCLVAADRTDTLIADISELPSSVNDQVKSALDNGANNLKLLLSDPDQCEGQTTTSEPTTTAEPTTTEEITTQRTEPTTTQQTTTQQTTTTQTQTNTTPGNPSGGVGPGGL